MLVSYRYMNTSARVALVGIIIAASLSPLVASAKAESFTFDKKTYYVVSGNDPAADSGREVCASVGLSCRGYTGKTTKICENFHKDAAVTTGVNGSSVGFYCDGAPQKGLACENAKNNCQICPACNVNADCDAAIGEQFREMYVECFDPTATATSSKFSSVFAIPGRWWQSLRDTVARSFDLFRQRLAAMMTVTIKHAVIQVQRQDGTTASADIPVDSYVCEFYQTNKKLATCGALAAADSFCVTAMQSQYAKAALCEENGIIVCSNPCTTKPQQLMPKQCAFDNDRPRGNQAPPLNFCTETKTIQVQTGAQSTKRAGEVCAHGGECATGICLGQPSDQGIKYFCSCSQTRHDTSCNK